MINKKSTFVRETLFDILLNNLYVSSKLYREWERVNIYFIFFLREEKKKWGGDYTGRNDY